MAKYHAVLNSVWDDPVFQQWSSDAKLVFLNLITSSRHNPVGIYAVTEPTLMFETKLSEDRFISAFKEIQQVHNGYPRVRYDQDHSVVWVINTLKHQPSLHKSNENLLKYIQAILKQYANSDLVRAFLNHYSKQDFREILEPLARGFGGASEPPNKDKDQDKSQDNDKNKVTEGGGDPPTSPAPGTVMQEKTTKPPGWKKGALSLVDRKASGS